MGTLLRLLGLAVKIIGKEEKKRFNIDAQGHKIRVCKETYRDGTTKFEYQYYIGEAQPNPTTSTSLLGDDDFILGELPRVDERHVFSGYYKAYFEHGMTHCEARFKDGIPHGKVVEYYGNGNIMFEGFYKDGKLLDEEKTEELEEELGAPFVTYFESGKIKSKGNYNKDGMADGKHVFYYENGTVDFESNYKDGKGDGKWVN